MEITKETKFGTMVA